MSIAAFALTLYGIFVVFVADGFWFFIRSSPHNIFWLLLGYGSGAPFAFAGIYLTWREYVRLSTGAVSESPSESSAT